MHLSYPRYAPHAPFISLSLIRLAGQYFLSTADHEAHHYRQKYQTEFLGLHSELLEGHSAVSGTPGDRLHEVPVLVILTPPPFKFCDIILKLAITNSFEIMEFRLMNLSKSDISAERLQAGLLLRVKPCPQRHEFKYFQACQLSKYSHFAFEVT